MTNSSHIFWFSGTGNSLYAAKKLSEALDVPLARITDGAPSGLCGGKDAKIGFVFPSYYGNLPRAVRAFVEGLEVDPDTYIFAVVTMGAVGQGSIGALGKALKTKGLRLSYGRSIVMPANYVIKYNPADSSGSEAKLSKIDARLRKMAERISSGAKSVRTLPITSDNLYKDVEALDAEFTVSDGCAGCGLCERICPVQNIRISGGRPEWLHHCEHCVACISWCPRAAIEHGERTQSRRRYRNPRISVDEFFEKMER